MTHPRYISLATCILIALFATPAIAQTAAEVEASASINAQLDGSVRPLDLIKARAQQIKHSAQDATLQLKTKTQMQLDAASSPGERKEIMLDAMGARVDIARERASSSGQMARGIKSLIMMHGGVIKNRFRLAISHMDNILARVETRLDKMADAGIDTSSVAQLQLDANAALDTAEADAKAVADFVATVDDGSDRTAVRTELAAKMKTAQASLTSAHQAVMATVRGLVKLAVDNKNKIEVDVAASSSATVQ